MKTSDFNFDLPEEQIAQFPASVRGQSRLLVMNRNSCAVSHRKVSELPSFLEKGTLMVFNNSRVRRSRIYGVSAKSGTVMEFLLLKKMNAFSWSVLAKRAKRQKPGNRFTFDDAGAEIVSAADLNVSEERSAGETLFLRFDKPIDDNWLDLHGHIPLPPYIRRSDNESDSERYQTVYAEEHGSAAAPTAGLHFTNELLSGLKNAGIETAFVTLHVGLGTFLPVRAENIEDHFMHEETYSISEETAVSVEKARTEGRKILAVGTTSVRTLESAWLEDKASVSGGRLQRGEGSTSIFIYPGYKFKVVDELFTNFHTPGSTLLMLVSAFAGRDFILESYREAVREGYRFFSYGDACLIK